MAQAINPFTLQDLALADEIIARSQEAIAFFTRCQTCGVEAQAYVERANAYLAFAKSIKAEFASGQQSL